MTRNDLNLPRAVAVVLLICHLAAGPGAGHAASPASSEFSKALAAERRGDYPRAHYTFSMLAGQGDPRAQHALGRLYEHGRGVVANPQTALQWYRRAAEQGHADSEYRLAVAYAHGLGGLRQDDREAVIWLKRAAEHGHGKARKMLARAYEQGLLGLQRDPKQARYWQHHKKSKKSE